MKPQGTRRVTKEPSFASLRAPSCPSWFIGLLCLLGMVVIVSSCSRGTGAQPTAVVPRQIETKTTPLAPPDAVPADAAPLPQIDSKRAFQYIKDIVAFGPRPMGSENHKNLENYITAHLKGDQIEDD